MSDLDYQSTFASKVWNVAGAYGLWMQRNKKDATLA